jgi:hypothetical protein
VKSTPALKLQSAAFQKNSLPPLYAIFADGCASGRYVYGDPIQIGATASQRWALIWRSMGNLSAVAQAQT